MPKPSANVSIRKAAAIAGVKRDTVARWVKTGKVAAVVHRLGGVTVKLVNVDAVVRLAQLIKRGRPPKGGR